MRTSAIEAAPTKGELQAARKAERAKAEREEKPLSYTLEQKLKVKKLRRLNEINRQLARTKARLLKLSRQRRKA